MITPKKSNQKWKKRRKKKEHWMSEEMRWERDVEWEQKYCHITSCVIINPQHTLLSYFYISFLSPSLYIFPRNKSKKLSLGIFLDLSITHLSLFFFEEIYYTSLPSLASLAFICLVSFLLFLVKYRERFRHGLVCCFFFW